jgi:RecB family exonuclease
VCGQPADGAALRRDRFVPVLAKRFALLWKPVRAEETLAARHRNRPHDAIADAHRLAANVAQLSTHLLDHADRFVAEYAGRFFAPAPAEGV